MKTNSISIACLFLFALVCIQCSTPTTDVATNTTVKVQEQKATKPIAAKEAPPTSAKTPASAAKEETAKAATPTLTALKPKTTEKNVEAEKKSEEPAKEVIKEIEKKEEVKKEVVKKEVKKATPKKKKKAKSKIKFDHLEHEFGTIKQGDVVKYDFKFKNTGKAPLVIKRVDVSCGCTFPSYPFIPIEPGKEGTIGVTFDSKNKIGRQKPTITVVTNGSPRTLKLNLLGFVE